MPNFSATPSKFGNWLIPVKAVTTATYTATTADLGTCITNRGNAGDINVTLPDPATLPAGVWIMFFTVAAGTFTVTCTDKIVAQNDAATSTIAFAEAGEIIGNGLLMINSGTKWLAEQHLGGPAISDTIGA